MLVGIGFSGDGNNQDMDAAFRATNQVERARKFLQKNLFGNDGYPSSLDEEGYHRGSYDEEQWKRDWGIKAERRGLVRTLLRKALKTG